MQFEDINKLCDVVRETSFAIHKYHRSGHLEKIYENALAHRLEKQGIKARQQFPLTRFMMKMIMYWVSSLLIYS